MKFDIRSWNNPVRLRQTVSNYSKMLMLCAIINIFYTISKEAWFLVGINVMYLIPALITIISKAKYDKSPPGVENGN